MRSSPASSVRALSPRRHGVTEKSVGKLPKSAQLQDGPVILRLSTPFSSVRPRLRGENFRTIFCKSRSLLMRRSMGGFERYMPGPMAFDLTQREPHCMTTNAVALEIEALVREHSRLVFRIAYSVVRNHADAEDVVQEVFLRVAKH